MDSTTAPVSKYTASFGLSLAITCVVNAILVIVKEKSKAVMDGMKSITGHHWITHSVFVIVLFVALGFILAKPSAPGGNRLLSMILAGIVIGGALIVGFYLIGD